MASLSELATTPKPERRDFNGAWMMHDGRWVLVGGRLPTAAELIKIMASQPSPNLPALNGAWMMHDGELLLVTGRAPIPTEVPQLLEAKRLLAERLKAIEQVGEDLLDLWAESSLDPAIRWALACARRLELDRARKKLDEVHHYLAMRRSGRGSTFGLKLPTPGD